MSIEIKISKKRIPYKTAMLYLKKRVEEVKNGTNRELLWILEHPTTYTAGVSFNKKEIIDKKIKIISETLSRFYRPDYYLVLPWHFKKEILLREKEIRRKGTKFIFPLPSLKII